jgi:lysozyme
MTASKKNKQSQKKSSVKKKQTFLFFLKILTVIFTLTGLGYLGLQHRAMISYYFGFISPKSTPASPKISEARVYEILQKNPHKLLGFDVSEYQGNIRWDSVGFLQDSVPLHYVFIRATAGNNRVDSKFNKNWREAKKHGFIRGAYHFYRPNENSMAQAQLFIKTVNLEKGDLPPVLDIENLPKTQSMDSLKLGLKRWLFAVEKHYGVKPIIYSGESYYKDFLKNDFKGYLVWIANYNFFVENIKEEWMFWQFTDKGMVPGIKGQVDLNLYNGTPKMLEYLRVK